MIQTYLLTSSIRRQAARFGVRLGAVRPGARIIGGDTARGRAP
jgi:hypothetical protein